MDNTYTATAVDIANFMANNEGYIGHLVSLKVAGDELKQDFHFSNPMSPADKVDMCGMLTRFDWNGEPGGRITMEGRIPYTNKGMLQGAIASKNKSAEVEFKINFYGYQGEKTFYKCFHTRDVVVKGKIIRKECSVTNEKAEDYTQIPNHHFILVIEGSDAADQELHVDYGNQIINVLPFGGKVGA